MSSGSGLTKRGRGTTRSCGSEAPRAGACSTGGLLLPPVGVPSPRSTRRDVAGAAGAAVVVAITARARERAVGLVVAEEVAATTIAADGASRIVYAFIAAAALGTRCRASRALVAIQAAIARAFRAAGAARAGGVAVDLTISAVTTIVRAGGVVRAVDRTVRAVSGAGRAARGVILAGLIVTGLTVAGERTVLAARPSANYPETGGVLSRRLGFTRQLVCRYWAEPSLKP